VTSPEDREGGNAADGGDLDDVAVSLRAQGRQHRLRDVQWPEQVDVELLLELPGSDLLDGAEQAVARVADDHVKRAECFPRLRDGRGHFLPVRDIQRQRKDRVTVHSNKVAEFVRGARSRGDLVTPAQRGLRELLAEASACAGYEPGPGHVGFPSRWHPNHDGSICLICQLLSSETVADMIGAS
jgi:hypothetical protein